MVRIQGQGSEYDRLERLVRDAVDEHGLRLDITGWTRKTFDVYAGTGSHDPTQLLVRVESFATTNGEVRVFEDEGLPVAETIAAKLEQEFDIGEAVLVR